MDWETDIKAARDRIVGHVRRTPVIDLNIEGLAHPVALKLEHMQHTGSFKPRGAFNTILSSSVPEGGIVAARAAIQRGLGICQSLLRALLGHRVNVMILEKALTLNLAQFED